MGPIKKRVEFVVSDDWVAMYLEGHLIYQGHELSASNALALLAGRMGFVSASYTMTPDMVQQGSCPGYLPIKAKV